MSPEIIEQMIKAGLPDADVVVEGDDGTHFQARVISAEFAGKNMVQQHQIVYRTLGEKMGTDIHALSLKTLTPEEWEQQK